MNKLGFALLSLLVVSSVGAEEPAGLRLYGFCSESYRFDSYGLGLEAGILGLDPACVRPKLNDEGCFLVGFSRGTELKHGDSGTSAADCRVNFNAGRREGYEVRIQMAGSACFAEGYAAGISAFHVAVRELNPQVGHRCLRFHRQGKRDAEQLLVQSPGSSDHREMECYSVGYYDASLFR